MSPSDTLALQVIRQNFASFNELPDLGFDKLFSSVSYMFLIRPGRVECQAPGAPGDWLGPPVVMSGLAFRSLPGPSISTGTVGGVVRLTAIPSTSWRSLPRNAPKSLAMAAMLASGCRA